MNTAVDMVSLSAPVKRFVGQARQALIDGRWQDAQSGETFEVFNPSNESVIARVADCKKADVDLAVAAARKAFDQGPWPRMSPSARGKILWKIGDLILENLEELAQLESLNNGKPIGVARGADVPLAADLFHYMAGWATKIEGSTIPISVPYTPDAQYHAYTRKEPIGVVAQIIPWNFPLLMAAWKLGPVLTAGCTVVLKPAEETPLSALRLAQLCLDAGLPPGVLNVVTGFGETAARRWRRTPRGQGGLHRFDRSWQADRQGCGQRSEEGHAGTGRQVAQHRARRCRHGVAIPGASNAIFFNHGQCCCAGSRLFVQEKSYDRVLEGVSKAAKAIRLGPGLDPQSEMGPLVSKTQFDRVTGFLRSGKEEGARTVTGGGRYGEIGFFVQPTVIDGTTDKMRVYQEEIFGPVVTVMPFKEVDDELIRRANDTVYGLAAGLWTSNIKRAHRIANALRAGTVWVNCYNIFDAAHALRRLQAVGLGSRDGQLRCSRTILRPSRSA
jgi:phenylacetaldehyde dehydrogenase